MTNGNKNYKNRQDCPNSGEILFEQYCEQAGLKYHHIGFDSKLDPVQSFWKVHPSLRSLPDYLVEKDGELIWCHVKGTANLKIHDIAEYINFERNWKHDCSFYIVFCFKGETPLFRTIEHLKTLLVGQTVKQWHDGVQYITVNL